MSVIISIAPQGADAAELARFFCANLSSQYISHSELQSIRALAPDKWAPDIEQQITDEIAACLAQPAELRSSQNWNGVIQMHDAGRLVGLAIVLYQHDLPNTFGILEDVVVDQAVRGKGYGTLLINWLLDDMKKSSIQRAFLESGHHNHNAHRLFERVGFKPASVVLMKEL
ncbi:GNAT family N-acetyltransferase [Devosia sp.]|uniref:GNAT family N-acetyltransferase n=1 Tax=Devosia sp. TaxID=1871048 RepID=UPI003267CECA